MPTINYDKLDLINIGTLKSDLVSTSAVRTNTLSAVESVTTALIYNSAGDKVSEKWDAAYSYSSNTSALILGDLTNLATNSSRWDNTWTAVYPNSANWNNTYSSYSTNSANFATIPYVNTNFLSISGGSLSGNLDVGGNLTVYGTLCALSGINFNGSTVFTSSSSLSVINFGVGPALYVAQRGGAGGIATFLDNYGTVFYIGNRIGSFSLGAVGINTSIPNKELTVVGDISATGIIYISSDNNSISWYSAYNFNNSTSALILGDLTDIANTSATWNTAYTNVLNNSANWNTAYTFNNSTSSLILGDLTNIANTSATWDSAYTFTNSNSSLILGDLTVVATNSASWGSGGAGNAVLAANSGRWDSAWSFSSGNSALILGDLSNIAVTSATWDSAYSYTNTNSANIVLQNSSPTLSGLTVLGNLSVLGDLTYLDTIVTVTSALSVVNTGTGPALTIKQFGAQPVATFIDADGGYMTIADTGSVGIGTQLPGEKLSVVGNISASGIIYAGIGNSDEWNSSYTFNNSTSSLILGDLTVVATNSATWGGGGAGYSWANANSALILGDLTNISQSSAKWDSAYSFSNSNSALILGDLTNIAVTSANWNTSYTFNNSTSSLILGDLTVVATNSASWGGGSAGYTWANANSALILGDLTDIAVTSAKWNTSYSYSNSTSALILGDLTDIAVTSANWNKSYTYFTWLTANSGSGGGTSGGNYIPLSGTGGGAVYGPLSSTSSASFSALVLSGGFTTLNGAVSTFTNAMTASNDFLLITVNGRTRGIRLYDF